MTGAEGAPGSETPAPTASRCAWCFAPVEPGDGIGTLVMTTPLQHLFEHRACQCQRVDEEDLRVFLRAFAGECGQKVSEYKAKHPSRARERHAGALLARIEQCIAAAGR